MCTQDVYDMLLNLELHFGLFCPSVCPSVPPLTLEDFSESQKSKGIEFGGGDGVSGFRFNIRGENVV